ncbi:MAG: hypothetical protein JWQ81_6190 [Amycolatopsis sp.]|jgi:hypothetical protein|uniref:DUF397 domain-containing protein n=1 Tax=Amycolatopsis sp. TaxID=37632 RepID=UPI0026022D9B|nr:DUF397 domain-containing protein [Amycolatopsis sp.]MCU1685451.1 hypothetical protein [Amycolatopsis sp.]
MHAQHTPTWQKSSYSNTKDDCVEIALDPADMGIRDSKAPHAGALHVSPLAWHSFL